jgi:hypothetical protein
MARMLKRGNEVAREPGFANLRQESKHWMSLADWAEAKRVLTRLVDTFTGTEDASLQQHVRPDLGHALLELGEVAAAKAVLESLVVEGASPRPTKRTLLDYCRSVIGWVAGEDGGQPMVVPGAGETPEELERATTFLHAIAQSLDEKWSCEWYDLQFRLIYGNYVWAKLDSRKLDTAKRQLAVLVNELGPTFTGSGSIPGIDQKCSGEADPELRALGGDVLRRRFVWLAERLK